MSSRRSKSNGMFAWHMFKLKDCIDFVWCVRFWHWHRLKKNNTSVSDLLLLSSWPKARTNDVLLLIQKITFLSFSTLNPNERSKSHLHPAYVFPCFINRPEYNGDQNEKNYRMEQMLRGGQGGSSEKCNSWTVARLCGPSNWLQDGLPNGRCVAGIFLLEASVLLQNETAEF